MKTLTKLRLSTPATALFISLIMSSLCNSALAASSAVILMYHRFAESDYPTTNIDLENFEAHLAELKTAAYTVLPVSEIIKKLKAGQELPDRTVGITMDDAYRSIYTEAWPRLKAAGFPFTVFISTGHVDHGSSRHLTWDQIREMQAAGVDFGHHTVSHLHMPQANSDKIKQEIDTAKERFQKELGIAPQLFAYPYGETSQETLTIVKNSGFVAAFGQHSGVIDTQSNTYYMPRFGLNEKFGGIERFRLIVNALSLPVQDMTPTDPLIDEENPPAIGFTVTEDAQNLDQLSCFLSHEGQRADIAILGPRVEIRAKSPMPVGRTRLNCTMPTKQGRWRWYGHQFIRIK